MANDASDMRSLYISSAGLTLPFTQNTGVTEPLTKQGHERTQRCVRNLLCRNALRISPRPRSLPAARQQPMCFSTVSGGRRFDTHQGGHIAENDCDHAVRCTTCFPLDAAADEVGEHQQADHTIASAPWIDADRAHRTLDFPK